MAGHSQFKNIMRRKGAQDAKRGQLFTKLGREIIIAARSGLPDPNFNPRLRAAIIAAREANMTKDKIEYAIKKGSGEVAGAEQYEEIRYEGYGPGGVAVIVEAATDNRNRTAPEIRSLFSKSGGNLGETGSVNFMFDRVGLLEYPLSAASEDAMMEAAIEAGADDCRLVDDRHEIITNPDQFNVVRDAMTEKLGDPSKAKLSWMPKTTAPVNDQELAEKILKLVELLEENDDVQEVFINAEFPDELMQRLAA